MAEQVESFKLEGISPLLCHNPVSMSAPKSAGKKGSNIPEPADEAEAGTYRNTEGLFCFPTIGVRNSMLSAAAAFKAPRGRGSIKSYLAHITSVPELAILINVKDGKALTEYTIDARRAVVQRSAIIRHRPRFEEWGLVVDLLFDPDLLPHDPKDLLSSILDDAGARFGIGDYRPGRGGPFGRFRVVE